MQELAEQDGGRADERADQYDEEGLQDRNSSECDPDYENVRQFSAVG
jgi:hypothetical protein